jgi:hypothetical protein
MNTKQTSELLSSRHVESTVEENVRAIKDCVDLLAEREMTSALQFLKHVAEHLQVQTTVTPEQIRDLVNTTYLQQPPGSTGGEQSEDDSRSQPKSIGTATLVTLSGPLGRRAWRRTHSTG